MKNENENIEQWLEKLKDEKIFRVPENYFDDFAGRLRARIEEESKPVQRFSWLIYLKPAIGIAAVLIIALLFVYVPYNNSLPQQNSAIVSAFKDSSNTNKGNDLSASFESLVHLSQSQFLSTLEAVVSQNDPSPIDGKALEEYLADNSFDYELIGSNK